MRFLTNTKSQIYIFLTSIVKNINRANDRINSTQGVLITFVHFVKLLWRTQLDIIPSEVQILDAD